MYQGEVIKTEAWKIRRMISLLSRAAKRPHTPLLSQHAMRFLVNLALPQYHILLANPQLYPHGGYVRL
jgi:hypothetical protein